MATTYKVVKGDTLWDIVQKPAYKNLIAGKTINAKIKTVAKINNLKDPDLILIGQTLKLSGSTATPAASTTANMPTITHFGALASNDHRMYVVWSWSKTGTKEYEYKWTKGTKTPSGTIWTTDNTGKTTDKACFYDAPEDAAEVRFTVRALDSEGKALSDWLSPRKSQTFTETPPKPNAPDVTIEGEKLRASIFKADGDFGGSIAQFAVYRNDETAYWDYSGNVPIANGQASWIANRDILPGHVYTVRCRIIGSNKQASEWSDYSSPMASRPGAPKITKLELYKDTDGTIGVHIEWSKAGYSNDLLVDVSHEIQYVAKDKTRFDTSDDATSISVDEGTVWNISDITIGELYYFRVRGIANPTGSVTGGDVSYWSDVKAITVGVKPEAPTTWSSASTVIQGNKINLYWVHNSVDGSSETSALVQYNVKGSSRAYQELIPNDATGDEKDKTKVFEFDTNNVEYSEGAEIEWSVATAGITGEYGPYSETRTFKIFIEPELELTSPNLSDDGDGELPTLEKYPLVVSAWNKTQDSIQKPVGYTIEIKANMKHSTVNYRGETVVIAEGETVFTRYYDTDDHLDVDISAIDVDLTNYVEYSLICTMAMDSGLVSSAFIDFIAGFAETEYPLAADVVLDEDAFTATIRPYIDDDDPARNVSLALFRREYDGSFTEIATGVNPSLNISVTDKHPSLDIPRYRIVATDLATGSVSFIDIVAPEFTNKPVVIQWEEEWHNFDFSEAERPWTGSALILPYNVDISNTQEPEVSIVKYVGREHPVTYYGTHLNERGTWNVVIDAEDQDTIYALNRLARWKGDVYVRAPSGIGYWANVTVSFSEKHMEVSIPVTLNITRVEGGA